MAEAPNPFYTPKYDKPGNENDFNSIKMPYMNEDEKEKEEKKEVILETKEYKLTSDDKTYNFSINRTDEVILIKCSNYESRLNINDLTKLTKVFMDDLNYAFKFMTDIFDSDRVMIKEIIKNEMIKLKIIIFDYRGKENLIEIELLFNKKNKDFIIYELSNKCDSLESEISKLKDEIRSMKKEIENFSSIKNEIINIKSFIKEKEEKEKKEKEKNKEKELNLKTPDENNNYKNENYNELEPKKINLIGELSVNSYVDFGLDYVFAVFNSVENIPFLVYSTKDLSLIFFNIDEMKVKILIKKAHNYFISNINHFFDKEQKKDIIMTVSYQNNNIKLWEINNNEPIKNIININNDFYLLSACFLQYDKLKCIVTSNGGLDGKKFDPIKIYNFNGKKILEIKGSNYNTNFVTTYFDIKTSKYYIISANDGFINSYNLEQNNHHIRFREGQNISVHRSAAVICIGELTKLVDSREDGFIIIWNFFNGELINKIPTGFSPLRGICIWNDNYIFIGCKDKTFKLVDINKGIVIKSIKGHNNTILTIKKINFSKYGYCLVSQGMNDEPIKLWSVSC